MGAIGLPLMKRANIEKKPAYAGNRSSTSNWEVRLMYELLIEELEERIAPAGISLGGQ